MRQSCSYTEVANPGGGCDGASGTSRIGPDSRLFDADGHDRAIDIDQEDLASTDDRRIVWVDIDLDGGASLDPVASVLKLDDRDRRRIEGDTDRPRLMQSVDRLHLTLEVLEPESDDRDAALVRREIDLLAGPNLVVTVHHGHVDAIERFHDGLSAETSFGALDAGELLSAIVDEVITDYFNLIETVEQRIDRLDQACLLYTSDAADE